MQLIKIPDPHNDKIGKLLERFHELPTWTQEKHNLNKIGLSSIGASCLFDIPNNQKGSLSVFKGKRIRIICISAVKYSKYNFAAKVFI
jgi:predicted Rossmann fold nucleotide-binding protein DprA/Smf involved in DNA uptake